MTRLSPAQIAALAQAERGRTESSKEAARVIFKIDQGTPRSAAQLAAELGAQGVHLSDNMVRRLRYVARLLHTLDKEHLDPEELRSVADLELLYRIQRAAEVTQSTPRQILERLETEKPAQPREYLQALIQARRIDATPESKEAWKQALPRVPLSTANQLNQAFGRWVKARDLTVQTGAQELASLLDNAGSAAALGPTLGMWGEQLGLTPNEAVAALKGVLERLPRHHWQTLIHLTRPSK